MEAGAFVNGGGWQGGSTGQGTSESSCTFKVICRASYRGVAKTATSMVYLRQFAKCSTYWYLIVMTPKMEASKRKGVTLLV